MFSDEGGSGFAETGNPLSRGLAAAFFPASFPTHNTLTDVRIGLPTRRCFSRLGKETNYDACCSFRLSCSDPLSPHAMRMPPETVFHLQRFKGNGRIKPGIASDLFYFFQDLLSYFVRLAP